jgi:cytoskeletal protein CcmA (bactofilin family)
MGFFKDFKDDITQAVNELLPDEVLDKNENVNTLNNSQENTESQTTEAEETTEVDDNVDMEILDAILTGEESTEETILAETSKEKEKPEEVKNDPRPNSSTPNDNGDVTIITQGTVINGNISSEGSLEVMGTIKGDVECLGKLSILGSITGNCIASEVFVTSKRLLGCINSEGNVKIGLGAIVIGDVTATSGVIAGAIKGNIDINGPIVIDSSAIIKGNIKAQSIQINNGAIIEGFCSLSYASVDIDKIFE